MDTPSKYIRDQVYTRANRSSRLSPNSPVINGRLVSLSSLETIRQLRNLTNDATAENAVVINFPSMPDTIELARKATYYTLSTFTLPDGFHQYQHTDPLRIPFSFKLHAFDHEYCPQGALTLLDVAAKLHALVLPVAKSGTTIGVKQAGVGLAGNTEADKEKSAASPSSNSVELTAEDGAVSFPVSVLLDLIYAGSDAPGISCVGYIEEVSVKLNGPWLTPPGSGNKNLPTSLDASFTFVHRPSHTNKFEVTNKTTNAQNAQAFAGDVKDRLYNTIALVNATAYQGFSSNGPLPVPSVPVPSVPVPSVPVPPRDQSPSRILPWW
jgi:hypothetical protein